MFRVVSVVLCSRIVGFASIYRVKLPHIEGHYPGDMCCNLHKIGRVRCPALIVHGEQDTLCTISHAKVGSRDRCSWRVTLAYLQAQSVRTSTCLHAYTQTCKFRFLPPQVGSPHVVRASSRKCETEGKPIQHFFCCRALRRLPLSPQRQRRNPRNFPRVFVFLSNIVLGLLLGLLWHAHTLCVSPFTETHVSRLLRCKILCRRSP